MSNNPPASISDFSSLSKIYEILQRFYHALTHSLLSLPDRDTLVSLSLIPTTIMSVSYILVCALWKLLYRPLFYRFAAPYFSVFELGADAFPAFFSWWTFSNIFLLACAAPGVLLTQQLIVAAASMPLGASTLITATAWYLAFPPAVLALIFSQLTSVRLLAIYAVGGFFAYLWVRHRVAAQTNESL